MSSHTSATMFATIPAIRLGYFEPTYKLAVAPKFMVDKEDGGRGIITGTVKEKHTPSDIPLKRRVRLYKKKDGRCVREVWSNDDGTYSFSSIAIQPYYITAFDHTGNYNSVIKDSIVPEVMT